MKNKGKLTLIISSIAFLVFTAGFNALTNHKAMAMERFQIIEKDSAEEFYGIAEKEYATEVLNDDYKFDYNDLEDMLVLTDNIVIECSGKSAYVDVVGKLKNGKYINLTHLVEWQEGDIDIISAYDGRIIGDSNGKTILTIKYGSFEKVIPVEVLQYLDLEMEIEKTNIDNNKLANTEPVWEDINSFALNSYSKNDRKKTLKKAKAMLEMTWTPSQDLIGWNKDDYFKKNIKVKGMPYSQTINQVDEIQFKSAIKNYKNNNFYSPYINGKNSMPRYGNDCSGFLCIAWGIDRTNTWNLVTDLTNGVYKKVGTYSIKNPSVEELKLAYKKLQGGDAMLRGGHTFLIASNNVNKSEVIAYEQTTMKAREVIFTYDSMANGKYMPFTKK